VRRLERGARRIVQLFIGLPVFGFGIACMVRAGLGTSPWDVLALGLTNHIPVSFGTMVVVLSGIVLLCWIPIREKPGAGTILNALLVGPAADLGLFLIPEATALWLEIIYLLVGILLIGLATGLYIGARFGAGPRDGLMTGLHRVTGWPVWVVRTGIELTVVLIGWLLGGTVGIGTILFALSIGPICQLSLRWFAIPLKRDLESDRDIDDDSVASAD